MPRTVDIGRLRVVRDVEPLARRRGWPYRVAEPAGEQRVEASTCLPEDELDRARLGPERIARHLYAAGGDHRARAVEEWCAGLAAPSTRRVPEAFVCEIPDALLVGALGIAITPQGEVLAQSNLGAPPAAALPWALRDLAETPPQPAPGAHVSLLTFACKSYAHWLLDSLPRLPLAAASDPGCRVVVPVDPTRFQLESLELLGVAPQRIVPQSAPVLRVERLLLTCCASRPTDPRVGPLLAMRDALVAATHGSGEPPPATRRLYVSRAAATRPVVDEEALSPVLERFGFELVAGERLPFAEQVALFSRAAVVAGAHGAGLHNHLFNPREATVVELFNPLLWTPSVLRTASACGHRHVHGFVENAGRRLETRVRPERLERLLALALGDDPGLADAPSSHPR